MMKNKLNGFLAKSVPALLCVSLLGACQKTFDIKPEDKLTTEQMYRNVYDADAAVLGIYGQFVQLVDKYIILNEVRGDLMDVTANADAYLQELSQKAPASLSTDNPYTDPRPFYKVINNCNDALAHFKEMYDNKLLDATQYNQRYTEVGMLRTWLYLQLGIHFGAVPYITQPIDDVADLQNIDQYPKLSFDSLLDELYAFTQTVPKSFLNQNTSLDSPTLIKAMDGYILKDGVFKFFIHRKALIGDIQLWRGKYLEAAAIYKDIMETGSNLITTTNYQIDIYDTYRITNDNSGRNTLFTIGTTNPWTSIFSNVLSEPETNRERMWTLPLDKTYAPQNPLINIFSVSAKYLLKPSSFAISNWDSQIRTDGGLTDRRGLNASYRMVNGQPEVLKYVSKYDPLNPYQTLTGNWILYRAAALHLRFAEAANRDGRSELAAALMNNGIANGFPTKIATYNGVPDTKPYDFNATTGSTNGVWYRNVGIRGRAVNQNLTIDPANKMIDTENKLINEAALEMAFEGYRWPDLLRITLRREKDLPGSGLAFINERIQAKTGIPAMFTKVDDLFLKFR